MEEKIKEIMRVLVQGDEENSGVLCLETLCAACYARLGIEDAKVQAYIAKEQVKGTLTTTIVGADCFIIFIERD